MKLTDLKYLLAYALPISTMIALTEGGLLSYLTVFVAFVLIPLIDLILPTDAFNVHESEKDRKNQSSYFTILLYGNLLLTYGVLVYFVQKLMSTPYNTMEWTGWILSTGISLGSNGINVAHELGHKKGWLARLAAGLLLLPSLYMHFTIEHNFGHHARVGTPEDPATSRFGESVFSFYWRSIVFGFLSACSIEYARMKSLKSAFALLNNKIVWFALLQAAYLYTWVSLAGLQVTLAVTAAAILSVLLLETINYIEHYGLERQKNAQGRYEPVTHFHSWNSDHQAGRILLYELTRHSDHHYKAIKKYQTLDHHKESPQLPYGYPGSILLSLVPPLWFKVMNPLVVAWKSDQAILGLPK
ncbi:MAG: alkane 1-monooxygenase [Saprospiraceae bacterium]|nr:alkane 1-monooxygenase [Saprospiraceae bacterium]